GRPFLPKGSAVSTSFCHLIGAGSFYPPFFAPREGDLVIACDGGLAHLSSLGYTPHLAVGDFDSFTGKPEELLPSERILRLPREKDDTDCLYALKWGLSRGYTRFLLHGSLGGERFSHAVANLALLDYLNGAGGQGVLLGKGIAAFLLEDGKLTFPNHTEGYFSVFSLEKEGELTLEGFKYPFTGKLQRAMPLGVSNEFLKDVSASVTAKDGSFLLIAEGVNDPLLFFEAETKEELYER
ncbi:MAG: thiamine diphosphokinase, partial [Clostridia bacterium]|nr:thiamine diphosphokinase [Clostridia bacterium]